MRTILMLLMMTAVAVAPANALTKDECTQAAAGVSRAAALYETILKQIEGSNWSPLLSETEGAANSAAQKLVELRPAAVEALGSYVKHMEELSAALHNCAETGE